MAKQFFDEHEARRLAVLVQSGRCAQAKLSKLLEPTVLSESGFNNVPGLTLGEVQQVVRLAMLRGASAWVPGGGMTVLSLVKRCARNAMIDASRRTSRFKNDVSDDVLELVADCKTLKMLDVDHAVKKRLGEVRDGLSAETSFILSRLKIPPGNGIETAELVVEAYRTVKAALIVAKGDSTKAAVHCGVSRAAVRLIAKDFRPKNSSRNRWVC